MLKAPAKKILAMVLEVEDLGAGLARLELGAAGLGAAVVAGRFAMLSAIARPDCILLRPFSYFSRTGPDQVGFLLKDVGAGTHSLIHARKGDPVHVLGPLGSTFPCVPGVVWAVAGGVGAAPFGMITEDAPWTVLFGARTAAEAGFAHALQARGAHVVLATDDGSAGFAGSVVALLRNRLQVEPNPAALYTCGPTAMMRAVAHVARDFGIVCYASLEERMGCGIGICRGCAHRDAGGTWRCICVDGPVYDAREIFA